MISRMLSGIISYIVASNEETLKAETGY
jgi:hypothetical protein